MNPPDDSVHRELLALPKSEPVEFDSSRYPLSSPAGGSLTGRLGRVAYRGVVLINPQGTRTIDQGRHLAQDAAVTALGERGIDGLILVRTEGGLEGWVNWLEIQWQQTGTTAPSPPRRMNRQVVETPIARGPTPSELILLDSIKWLQPNELSGLRVAGGQPSTQALKGAIAAALLANEKAGNIRLGVTEFTRFHFIRASRLESHVIDRKLRWPAFTFEWWFSYPGVVEEQVYEFIGETSSSPENHLSKRTMNEMVDRGLLERRLERQRLLRFFAYTRERLILPGATSRLMATHALLSISNDLARFEQTRPIACKLMFDAIRRAFSRRTESSD